MDLLLNEKLNSKAHFTGRNTDLVKFCSAEVEDVSNTSGFHELQRSAPRTLRHPRPPEIPAEQDTKVHALLSVSLLACLHTVSGARERKDQQNDSPIGNDALYGVG